MNILKLGGSIITNKEKYLEPNLENIKRIATELSRINGKYILVHGAGSFGHIKALEFGLEKEIIVNGKEINISKVMRDVEYLNSIVLEELILHNIPAVGLPPHSIYSPYLNFDVVINLLESGFVPVLYGDGFIWDSKHRIISGDDIIRDLVGKIKTETVIFATDVDGLYTKDPKKFHDAEFIEHIKGNNYRVNLLSHDATGSMKGKMEKIDSIVKYVNKVVIINGNIPQRIMEAMSGKNVKGTVIEK